MKKKALRRHQQRVARFRHVRIIWRYYPWHFAECPYEVLPDPEYTWLRRLRRPWQAVCRSTMSGEPKHWQQQTNLRPSRIRQNQALRLVTRGMDADVAIRRWPDYRKPHIYYW